MHPGGSHLQVIVPQRIMSNGLTYSGAARTLDVSPITGLRLTWMTELSTHLL